MSGSLKSRIAALFCAFTLLACALATHPVAEIGMNDDWSYVLSAQVLARTGHVVYNGWATAMLGWQLFLGALFAKFFGPSFTAIRASTLLVALATAVLIHRTMMRAGVNNHNATVGTLTLVLSPLFLPLALSFMTDVGGLFFIALCLYACLRALHERANKQKMWWLGLAAISSTLGGTSRQIVWLGVLVIVPCTVWLGRRSKGVVVVGVMLIAGSSIVVFTAMHWFATQPYSLPESLAIGRLDGAHLNKLALQLTGLFLGLALFLMPISIAFLGKVTMRRKRTLDTTIGGGLICSATAVFLCFRHPNSLITLLAPFLGNYVTFHGLVDGTFIQGRRPIVLSLGVRVALTVLVLVSILGFVAFLLDSNRATQSSQPSADPIALVPWRTLLTLLLPFCTAYVALLIPRGLAGELFDRYLLPLLLIGLILLLRVFQDRVQPNLPAASYVFTLVFALYAVAGTHDAFAMFRARQRAIVELLDAGVPATAIDGGLEYNSMTQVAIFGYVNDPRIQVPARVYAEHPLLFPPDCHPQNAWLTPAIVPGYALSFDPVACGGLSHFAPITFHNWLGAYTASVYVVAIRKGSQAGSKNP